jgi:16S rRNA (cytosine1402-N4)-methyltransferase
MFSLHFDEARRGFSLLHDGPLDMRFNQAEGGKTAADIINYSSENLLVEVLYHTITY